jgi:hypothetical protein
MRGYNKNNILNAFLLNPLTPPSPHGCGAREIIEL